DGFLAPRRRRARCRCDVGVADPELGADRAAAAVLEGHLALDMPGLGARIERLDEAPIALGDDAAAHLAGAPELAVIGVELLVQDEEAADLRGGKGGHAGKVAVGFRDAALDKVVD